MGKAPNIGKHSAIYTKSKKRTRRVKPLYIFFIIVSLVLIFNIGNVIAYFTASATESNNFTIQANYTVTFHANGGTGLMSDQTISYNKPTSLTANAYSQNGYQFNGWNTKPDGSGTPYADEELVTNLPPNGASSVLLYAQWLVEGVVAEINGQTYTSLQLAIDDVPTTGVETTIKLLTNTRESVKILAGKNIVFNFQHYTLTNGTTVSPINNSGTIRITNGTIRQTVTNESTIHNNSNGTVIITGGKIYMSATGGKQALYNQGTAIISGTAYLESVSAPSGTNSRGTVQNTSSGTLTVTGGTIVAVNNKAIVNDGALVIGTQDDDPDVTSPVIQGAVYGLQSSTNFDFYNGILKGKSNAKNGAGNVAGKETGYELARSSEVINGETYQIAYLASSCTVTFDGNGGTVSETTRHVEYGEAIGALPTPDSRSTHFFAGWYTAPSGGTLVTSSTTIQGDIIIYAQWEEAVAQTNSTPYRSLSAAVAATSSGGTAILLKNTNETISINTGKIVTIDLNNKVIGNSGTNNVFKNNGTLTLKNGKITSSTSQGAINNESTGTLYLDGVTIEATGSRQALYNRGGTTTIYGSSTLSATTNQRATVHNLNNGTVIITEGTIKSTGERAIYNESGTITIGTQGGGVDITSPIIQGTSNGIDNRGTFNFYDGIIRGKNSTAITGTAPTTESGYSTTTGIEQIEGTTYNTAYLVAY